MRVGKSLLWYVSLMMLAPAISSVDCSTCDCVHLPCPPTCKSCCGISRGRIKSVNDSNLKLDNGDTFVLSTGAKTQSENQKKAKGTDVTIYFKRMGDAKVAEKIETQSKDDSTPK